MVRVYGTFVERALAQIFRRIDAVPKRTVQREILARLESSLGNRSSFEQSFGNMKLKVQTMDKLGLS